MFRDSLGLENQFNEPVDEMWEGGRVFGSRMVLFGPNLDGLHFGEPS